MTIDDEVVRECPPGVGPIRVDTEGRTLAVLNGNGSGAGRPDHARTADHDGPGQATSPDQAIVPAGRAGSIRSWPVLLPALAAAVAVWSGWVGIGQMTGFG
jgi:hypothetical protein